MPRYRVIKPLPETLAYRDGSRLVLDRFVGMYGGEQLSYRKDQPVPYSAVLLCRGSPAAPIDEQLANGFAVDAGSPADRIMRSLVAKGYAQPLPE